MYPVTLVSDRYCGAYSNALWTAWNMQPSAVPWEIFDGDCECHAFWLNYEGLVGKGATPEEACGDLWTKAGYTESD